MLETAALKLRNSMTYFSTSTHYSNRVEFVKQAFACFVDQIDVQAIISTLVHLQRLCLLQKSASSISKFLGHITKHLQADNE